MIASCFHAAGARGSIHVVEPIVLHALGGCAADEPLAALLGDGLRAPAHIRPDVGRFARVVAAVSGPTSALAEAGADLPAGAAHAEAVALRLQRAGGAMSWGEPQPVASVTALLQLSRERGRSSVAIARADASLVTGLQLGGWYDTDLRGRVLRRALLSVPRLRMSTAGADGLRIAADVAFWRGDRDAATPGEWLRWTRCAYSVLVYHRIAGEHRAGQERVDVDPVRFDAHLRVLRRAGFRHLSVEQLVDFHESSERALPPRSVVVTVDDGFRDVFEPLLDHASEGPQLFVSTAEVGGTAHWLDHAPLLSWGELRSLAGAGVSIGSHARRHRRLAGLARQELDGELLGSRDDLVHEVAITPVAVAYPHGEHDADVRAASADSGYRVGFTTEKGRNAAGTDVYRLARVSVHAADGRLAVLWKALTGEALPPLWLRIRRLRGGSV
jgi:peptidoglycan/xylan/chitin deacetylase (PgdA/CDA1 family)